MKFIFQAHRLTKWLRLNHRTMQHSLHHHRFTTTSVKAYLQQILLPSVIAGYQEKLQGISKGNKDNLKRQGKHKIRYGSDVEIIWLRIKKKTNNCDQYAKGISVSNGKSNQHEQTDGQYKQKVKIPKKIFTTKNTL